MSEHHATIRWTRKTPDFSYDTYDRTHTLTFGGGMSLEASSAPEFKGNARLVNPEEAFVGALSSCHMLTFLAVAARSRLVVDSYEDHAVGTLGKNAEGRLCVTKVVLRPNVRFAGVAPTPEKLHDLHETSHRNCFIASSVLTEVTVEAPLRG